MSYNSWRGRGRGRGGGRGRGRGSRRGGRGGYGGRNREYSSPVNTGGKRDQKTLQDELHRMDNGNYGGYKGFKGTDWEFEHFTLFWPHTTYIID